MAEFRVPMVAIDAIQEHPNADRLEMAVIGGFRCAVLKGRHRPGDVAAYIPEASVLPDPLIEELGLTGRLAGSKANRVKALRLRGEVSQGLIYDGPGVEGLAIGDDAAERLGIVKWVPPVPVHMNGVAVPGPTVKYDVENWQAWPNVLLLDEPVIATEKLHGTWCQLGFDPNSGPSVASKGMADRGLRFDLDADSNERNLYCRMWQRHGPRIERIARAFGGPVFVLGEVHGPKVQDLDYGRSEPTFAVFDVRLGSAGIYDWLEYRGVHEAGCRPDDASSLEDVESFAHEIGAACVPVVYHGPFGHDRMLRLASHPSVLGGGMREGIVVRAAPRRRDDRLGAAVLKYVNPAYLTRSGGTEHN